MVYIVIEFQVEAVFGFVEFDGVGEVWKIEGFYEGESVFGGVVFEYVDLIFGYLIG